MKTQRTTVDKINEFIDTGKVTIPIYELDDFREQSRGIITDMFPEFYGETVTLHKR